MDFRIRMLRSILRNVAVRRRYPAIINLLQTIQPVDSGINLIRLGPKTDGGYLIPDDLTGVIACFSPGVCGTSGFELDCANRGQKVFLADASVDGPAVEHSAFHFTKKFLGRETRDKFITIGDWVNASIPNISGDLILQMDIEGAEYDVIDSMPPLLLDRFRILVIELHGLHRILNGSATFWNQFVSTMKKLAKNHLCVHIHPNNTSSIMKFRNLEIPDLIEITFLRRNRAHSIAPVKNLPHPLDWDCDDTFPHLPLPRCWWRLGQ